MQKRKFSPNPNIALRAVDAKKRKAYRVRRNLSTFLASREPKYMETGLSVTSLTSTPQVFALSDIAQGDNYTQRNGNLVQSKYLQYEYSCNQVAGTLPINFKMALVLDRQPNGTAPTFAQVFDTSVSQLVFTMKNIAAFQERFKILKEDIGIATSSVGGDGGQSCYKGYIDLSKLKQPDQVTRWNGTTATSPNTNGYYLLIVSTTVTVNECQFRGAFRYVFNES